MKRHFINALFAASVFLVACEGKQEQNGIPTDVVNNPATAVGSENPDDVPVFTFDKAEFDFGQIKQGEKVAHAYKFTNTGKKDLVITSATGSCGCTVPQFPKMPIPPGGTGVIDVTFDSAGKSGKQHKTITVVANTVPNTTVLSITGEIIDAQPNH